MEENQQRVSKMDFTEIATGCHVRGWSESSIRAELLNYSTIGSPKISTFAQEINKIWLDRFFAGVDAENERVSKLEELE